MEILGPLLANIGILSAFCFFLGIVLIIVEMFVPGFGFPGVTGVILLLASVIMIAESVLQAFVLLVIILVILGIALSIIIHSAAKGKLSNSVILSTSMNKERGYSSNNDMEYFLGKKGIVLSRLRPSGSVDFDGVKLDVVADGTYIDKGAKVEVVKVEGSKIVVREIND
ncbi:NfeD family protein [Dethiothermospora halolimnae]|uniref:NfeD family protein n=1 Tax=Dethiothermospora halolimnae TaxID=3114390 RepID=UPI003CCC200A